MRFRRILLFYISCKNKYRHAEKSHAGINILYSCILCQKGRSSFSSVAAKSTGAAGAAFIGGNGASIGGI